MTSALSIQNKSSTKILYFTDKYGVSDGYTKAFNAMLMRSGIRRNQIILTNIYSMVTNALAKVGQRKTLGFNPEKKSEITAAVQARLTTFKPDLVVVSCPAVLGLLCDWDRDGATLDKCRGGLYTYMGIRFLVVLPITAMNTHVDERLLQRMADDDEDGVRSEPYRIKQGQWILSRDWEKVGRFANGKEIRIPPFEYSIVRSIADAMAAKRFLTGCVAMAADIETGCYPAQITCVGFTGITASGTIKSFVFPFYDANAQSVPGCFWDSEDDHVIVWSIMGDVLKSDVLKIFQNGYYDVSYFIKYGLFVKNYFIDSMYLWYSVYMELPKRLDFISSILQDNYTYWKDDIKGVDNEAIGAQGGMEQYWRYCAQDTYYTLFNALRLMFMMQHSEVIQTNYQDTFNRVMCALAMSMRGVKADKERLGWHRDRLILERDSAVKRFRYMIADPDFNINSPTQKCSLLYDVLGARERNDRGRFIKPPAPGERKTKENSRSAGKTPLKMIRTEHPFFKYIVDALEAGMTPQKQLSDIFGQEGPDGKIVGGVKMFTDRFRYGADAVGTTSQRYSTKNSSFWDGRNIQNIREEYRDWLVADQHCILMNIDYSQSDDVFMGYEAQDPEKIKVIESGVDAHAVHGELFFKMAYDDIVAGKKARDPLIVHPVTGIRQISKRITHGTNFQMAALTLYLSQMGRDATIFAAKLLGFEDADTWGQERLVQVCQYLMSQYRKKYTRFTKREYYADILRMLREDGTITNAFGVTRRFLSDPEDNGTQREATGHVGQSNTAGNMNRSQYEMELGFIPKSFRDGVNPDANCRPLKMGWHSHGFMILIQGHDSFTCQLDLRNPNWQEAAHNVLHVMGRPVIINGHTVRVRTEATFSKRWYGENSIEWDGNRDTLSHVVTRAYEAA